MRIGSQRCQQPAGDCARWVRWRMERLTVAGFCADLARRLAGDDRIDLHAVLDLVDRGCPPHLAARIVAPLDDPVWPA
jgi:hypothetical protein